MRKIYIVGGGSNYACWMEGEIVQRMEDANLVVFTGGEDVDPSIYNKTKNPTTFSNISRDRYEMAYFKQALKLNKHIIGICRGSQLMCALNGGILVQHQENPAFLHYLFTHDNRQDIVISSTHHQAAYPFNLPKSNYKILAWTEEICKYHYGENFKEELNPPKECEIVYYPKTRCLGIQGHPEMIWKWNNEDADITSSIKYYQNMLNDFMADKL